MREPFVSAVGRMAIVFAGGLLLAACALRPSAWAEVEGNVNEPVSVYVASRVRTGDLKRPVAQAIAVRGAQVLAVGTRAEILERAGRGARVHELGEAVIVPGLQDAHAHIAGLGRALTVTPLRGARSPEEIVERLRAAGPESRQGDWLIGRGWDQNEWSGAQRGFPHRRVLDEAFPHTPVFLSRVDGHAAWVNGAALRRAHLTRDTPDPPGGRFERDEHGELTGVLIDNAIEQVSKAMPELTDAQHAGRVMAGLRRAAEVGLTAVHDAGTDLRTFRYLQYLDASGQLPVRVYAMAEGQGEDWELWTDLGTFRGNLLTMRSVKMLMDGALGSRGAALWEPYSDAPGETGLLLLTPEELQARAEAFMSRGFQVNVHAIGDRANDLTLEALRRALAATGNRDGRHRLEHAQIFSPTTLQRMAELGVVASMQPTHATSDMPWAESRLGPERIRRAYAWRGVLAAGVPLAFGSDFPVEEPEPLAGIYAARTRQDARGLPEGGWYPEQRLTGEEALHAFTAGAAFASFSEERLGRLAPGMDADFTVLSVDPVEGEPGTLLGARVHFTVVAGREVRVVEGAAPR